MDRKHGAALNNLGVAYANLSAPILAVAKYKASFEHGNTLAASNLAYILIDAGDIESAAKILEEAQKDKRVHENVRHALVKIEELRRENDEIKTKCLTYAAKLSEVLLQYSDAFFVAKPAHLNIVGTWASEDGNPTEISFDPTKNVIEIKWGEEFLVAGVATEKYRVRGTLEGLASKAAVESWTFSILGSASFFGTPSSAKEESFKPYGNAFVCVSTDSSTVKIFLEKTDSRQIRTITLVKKA